MFVLSAISLCLVIQSTFAGGATLCPTANVANCSNSTQNTFIFDGPTTVTCPLNGGLKLLNLTHIECAGLCSIVKCLIFEIYADGKSGNLRRRKLRNLQ